MPEPRSSNDMQSAVLAARGSGVHERTLLGFVLLTFAGANEVMAGDAVSIDHPAAPRAPVTVESSLPLTSIARIPDPGFFAIPKAEEPHVFSATDFIPRKHTMFDHDSAVGDAPMLRGTTVWQRLDEYRVHDGVRLLTLWESPGSSVSLQAGKRGGPSLQWSSRLSNHDGPTRGLLDRLFSVSLAGASNGLHNVTHGSAAPAVGKPAATPGLIGAARLAPSGSP